MAGEKTNPRGRPKKKDVSPGNNAGRVFFGLIFLLLALVSVGGIIGGAGRGGFYVFKSVWLLFGAGYVLFPVGLGTLGACMLLRRQVSISARQWATASIGILATLGFLSVTSGKLYLGGFIGALVALPLVTLFENIFAGLILFFALLGSFVIFFDQNPRVFLDHLRSMWQALKTLRLSKKTAPFEEEPYHDTEDEQVNEIQEEPEPTQQPLKISEPVATEDSFAPKPARRYSGKYVPPPLSLLEKDRGKANVGDVKMNANVIRRTLANFGIEVEMDEVTIGPTVTRYALKPAQGVKLSRIAGLQNDLALALAARSIRMELPIPGKSLVGIEIPNISKATIGLASLIGDAAFANSEKPLLAALGRNISGKPVLKAVADMPHLLIAGTTGSGKSVTIHAIITSLLYRHGPDDMRFIFVDPKRVELTLYNKIPHLLTPVITDSKKAILALKWAANEMSRRYDILEGEMVRDIKSYHKKVAAGKVDAAGEDGPDRMPYIVIVIDELADIMQAYPRELESAIVRLAQMSRAVGIHLILSTQRPEVNVITGLIKANVPSRIALRVPTQIDSRTILDTGGAEKLLGQGDMLAIVGENQPERLQSAFITEDEVKSVVKYLADAFRDELQDTIELTGTVSSEKTMFDTDMDGSDDDDLYEEARRVVMEAGKASTSYIQRKLKVGYARAARLMDMLEERGVIGPQDGAKPREVLDRALQNPASDIMEPPQNI